MPAAADELGAHLCHCIVVLYYQDFHPTHGGVIGQSRFQLRTCTKHLGTSESPVTNRHTLVRFRHNCEAK
jgi:hypothetical protein